MATLAPYRQKRDFRSSAEPKGRKSRKSGSAFVIQKHDARRLHYDLRLEMGGVLKSWAVTRGPSLIPGEKRLAVEVEDHPLEYGDFEGTIPKGAYGGGSVIVWDTGTWSPVGDADKGFRKGHLEFELRGKKLSGRWHLVRMRKKPDEKRTNWLLIKADDAAGRGDDAPDILEEQPESVKSGRRIEQISDSEPRRSTKKRAGTSDNKRGAKRQRVRGHASKVANEPGAIQAPMTEFIEPALATLQRSPPTGETWVHEIKFDGYRLQAVLNGANVTLRTRSGLDWSDRFGSQIVTALQNLSVKNAIIDGEVVVETASGASDFSTLQADLSEGRSDRFTFYVFDLLHVDGYDIRKLPLAKRKDILARVVEGAPPAIRYSAHFEEEGSLVFQHACRLSLEGVISKKADAPYRSGRTKAWVKSKCSERQEFVIAGYVPSSTSRSAIGSLILGVYENRTLVYVGRVGTGFSHASSEGIFKRLKPLATSKSAFSKALLADQARNVRFVEPQLVAEVEFRSWTADGHLRHASFRGLRDDKPAIDVTRETSPRNAALGAKPQRRRVALTHPDRVYWPDVGVTKEGLADYYADVWPWISPHIAGRALALLRCPTGISGQQFFQKHAWKGLNDNIVTVTDPKDGSGDPLISINSLDGLIGLVQSAALEIHPWGSTIADWERPDRIVMDLDPGEGVSWERTIAAAEEVRQRLEHAGLHAFLKTSGGKGLHVVAPLTPKADWPAVKAFTKQIADEMASDDPAAYVSTVSKAKRKGKILVDYLRNQRGMTAVAPYSTRARPGAPVSMPLAWEELSPAIGPAYFNVENALTRLSALKTDPWAEFYNSSLPLPDHRKTRTRR